MVFLGLFGGFPSVFLVVFLRLFGGFPRFFFGGFPRVVWWFS